jgi:hypothetical protein
MISFFLFFFFVYTAIQTQVLALARQVLTLPSAA